MLTDEKPIARKLTDERFIEIQGHLGHMKLISPVPDDAPLEIAMALYWDIVSLCHEVNYWRAKDDGEDTGADR